MKAPADRLRAAGQRDLADRIEAVVAVIVECAATNENFAESLLRAFGGPPHVDAADGGPVSGPNAARRRPKVASEGRGSRRRASGPFDPFAVYLDGEAALRSRLAECSIEQLRDIVAEHGMDYDRLALKWKSPDRVIGRIVDTVAARSRKGHAFLRDERDPSS